ncbi:hypothetical protein BKA69DRAFT_1108234 [Paraphysoderma sedebokerense]|nr:hypothetical protein BKA69DRAFT_1108234 [Paraphysoderma sedebokerense]
MSVHPSEETRLGRVEHVVFDIKSMPWTDTRFVFQHNVNFCETFQDWVCSAIQKLLDVVKNYHTRGITVSSVRMRASIRKKFTRSGLVDVVEPERFFSGH